MNKKKILLIIFVLLLSGCANHQNDKNDNSVNDENIALTIDNNSEKEAEKGVSQWPEERGILSETKDEKSYIYEGYNFDFGEGLPKNNYIKMVRNIKTDICQTQLLFPVDENNSEEIEINFIYNPQTKEVSDLKSNKEDININDITKQLSMIYNMVNAD